jgi:glutathione synthase/RimK-type ligase-like ATP-grasp enzyme
VIYADFFDDAIALPQHSLVVNLIGDADACRPALERAQGIAARTQAPVINSPARVRLTGREDNARRLGHIPGVIAPVIETVTSRVLRQRPDLHYPLLLRRPGFHTGRHFSYVEDRDRLKESADELAADELLVIQYLDARGPDGMARKYRVMFIDGRLYPLHLAVSSHWKVHYFSADMAENAAFRQEEERFLNDMPAVLGEKAMRALQDVCTALGLEYAGIDFALSADGSILLFEANATMVVFPPNPDPIWDYRRGAIDAVLSAATDMLLQRARGHQ